MDPNCIPAIVPIEGEMTIFTAAAIREQLLAAFAAADMIEVDLSRVSEIDSAGVQLMAAAVREACARSTALHFAAPSDAVLDVLSLLGLTGKFGIASAAEDAQ